MQSIFTQMNAFLTFADGRGDLWAFCAAFFAFLATAVSWWIARQSAATAKLDRLLVLEQRFSSDDMKSRRYEAATAALDALNSDNPFEQDLTAMEEVFDFLTMIGFIEKNRGIDREMAWHAFYYWIYWYWAMGWKHIRRKQKNDIQLYRNFDLLQSRLARLDWWKSRFRAPRPVTEENLKVFFIGERDATGREPNATATISGCLYDGG